MHDSRVRIAHIQLFPILSGVQRVTLEEYQRLDPDRFDMHLATSGDGPVCDAVRPLGVTCRHFEGLKHWVSPRNDYRTYRELRDWMRSERFDVVHTHSSKTGFLGRLAASAASVPAIVHTVHGFSFPSARNAMVRGFYRRCETYCGRRTDRLICLNRDDVRVSRELGIPADRIDRVPNGVDPVAYAPLQDVSLGRDLRAQLLPGDPLRPLVLMVGRLWRQKNPLAFVRAAIHAINEGSDAIFCIAGEGTLREELEQLIDESGLCERIHLLGWRDDIPKLLPLADLFVLPSLWEGMPLVLLEAESCGVPVIATDIPGNRECVVDGEDGILLSPNDDLAFADAINRLIGDHDTRKRFGEAARAKILANFNISTRFDRILGIYEELLNRPLRAEAMSSTDCQNDTFCAATTDIDSTERGHAEG